MPIQMEATSGFMDVWKEPPTIAPQTIQFKHSYGTLDFTMDHDPMNALRAMLMRATDYPNTIILPSVPPGRMVAPAKVHYEGYGAMVYDGSVSLTVVEGSESSSIVITSESYPWNLDPYIHETEDGIEYDDPYYYYVNKPSIALTIRRDAILGTIPYMNQVFPYERFESLNYRIYDYIKPV